MSAPQVRIDQWIKVGTTLDGLVMDIYDDNTIAVGYYQNREKAIKEDVVWNGIEWQFKYSGPNGTYLRGTDEARVKRGPVKGIA
jgi:hypothetical protein